MDMFLRLLEEVKKDFQARSFTINLTSWAFKGIFSDMTIEIIVLNIQKVISEYLIRKDPAVLRWTLNQNILGKYTQKMYSWNNIKDANSDYSNYIHTSKKHLSLHRDEDVLKMLNYMKSHMSDHFTFDKSTGLINIGHDGLIATPEISYCLLNIINNGSQWMLKFLERLEK